MNMKVFVSSTFAALGILLASHTLANAKETSCSGEVTSYLPEYNIPAGTVLHGLLPGGYDPDWNPTSYEYHDSQGHHLFIPNDKVSLISCQVVKHSRSNPNDPGYSLIPLGATDTHND